MADKLPPFQSYASRSSNSAPRSPGKALYIVLILLLILVIGVGAAQYLSSRAGETQNSVPTPIEFEEPIEQEQITPSPQITDTESSSEKSSEELDRAELSIVIHNGSGAAGVAKKASDILKGLGYTVRSTSNAGNFDYEETEIQISSEKKEYLELLQEDLSSSYTIGETSTDYTGAGDALIIIGEE